MKLDRGGKAPSRVVIENVRPSIDNGRFPIKRVSGEWVEVAADIFTDGHDLISAVVLYRTEEESNWFESPMEEAGNDLWRGSFQVFGMKRHVYTVLGWIDEFKTWRRDFKKRLEAGQNITVDLRAGIELIEEAAQRASEHDAARLRQWAISLKADGEIAERAFDVLDEGLARIASKYADRTRAQRYDLELPVVADGEKAQFSAWYEMFPRSCADHPNQHGSFRECEKRLDYVASMGFDVLYLPPIHPIGETNRKGKNNDSAANSDDVGSPWAIGGKEGGHKSIHPALGTEEDLQRLREQAGKRGIALALDVAFQTTPDHPYVKEHPQWFKHRPDGSIQYAENPPKKYEDIYPFDFESDDWEALWRELLDVVLFWIDRGIRIFRVDNPHTKPFAFWEWLIAEVKRSYPEVIFLAEAFTRPKVMYRLAKLGFTQSYTYFAWRNSKVELMQYMTELTRTEVREFFRPNFWPNTPDILPEFLHHAGRPAFATRLILAATLSSNYGIYGPAFELFENHPIAPGREEYLDSEKYEIKRWDINRPDSLRGLIERVNRIRRENKALQSNAGLRFHEIGNDQLIAYSKTTRDLSNIILVIVNLDPYRKQSGWLTLPLERFQIDTDQSYQVHDLLGDARYLWHGPRNFIEVDPALIPAQIFILRRHLRTERDFDYFM